MDRSHRQNNTPTYARARWIARVRFFACFHAISLERSRFGKIATLLSIFSHICRCLLIASSFPPPALSFFCPPPPALSFSKNPGRVFGTLEKHQMQPPSQKFNTHNRPDLYALYYIIIIRKELLVWTKKLTYRQFSFVITWGDSLWNDSHIVQFLHPFWGVAWLPLTGPVNRCPGRWGPGLWNSFVSKKNLL